MGTPVPAEQVLPAAAEGLRVSWRTHAVAGAVLLGFGGLVALKLWVLARMLSAYVF